MQVKVISGQLEGDSTFLKEIKNAGIEFKRASNGLEAYIVDKKKVILALSSIAEEKPEYHFIIWPENTHMANALQHYFDKLWETAKKV